MHEICRVRWSGCLLNKTRARTKGQGIPWVMVEYLAQCGVGVGGM